MVADQTRRDLGAAAPAEHPGLVLVRELVAAGRVGRKAGQGFYDYDDQGGKRLWSGLSRWAAPRVEQELTALAERLLSIQMLEAARCVRDGVLSSVADANVGAVMGWGFAPATGGPLQAIAERGVAAFLQRCQALAALHGPRWRPDEGLADALARVGIT